MLSEQTNSTIIWQEFSERLRNFIASKVNASDIDDILQEVFIKIEINLSKLEHEERLTSWLYQVTRNQISDYYRKKKLETTGLDGVVDARLEDAPNDNFGCMLPMIDKLPVKYKQVVYLHDVKGFKNREIAERLKLSESGIKSRLQRGREMLKDELISCCHYKRDEKGCLVGERNPDCG